MKIEEIVTKRLRLRGFTKDDAVWAYSIWNDPQMGQYLPDEAKEEVDEAYIKELEILGEDEECCYLIPVLKDTGERVGTCSFIPEEDGKVYDIAYCVHEKFWNRGFATEIAQGMIDYARRHGAEKVTILVSKENVASNHVAQNCGGVIESINDYRKKGMDVVMQEYKYVVMV